MTPGLPPTNGRDESYTAELNARNLNFVNIVIALVAGAVFIEASSTLSGNFTLNNFQAIFLVLCMFLVIEVYLILNTFHDTLKLQYKNLLLYLDSFIGMTFLFFVDSIKNSTLDRPADGESDKFIIAISCLCALFILFLVRHVLALLGFRKKYNEDERKEYDIFHIFYVPIFFDVIGLLYCGFIVLMRACEYELNTEIWVAGAIFLVYFVIRHYNFDTSRRKS